MTVDHLRRAANRTPSGPAVVGVPQVAGGDPPTWSWMELDAWVDTVARALVQAGIDPGARVAMRLPPCPEAVVLLHAVARAGATLVPIHAGWTESEFARALTSAGRPSLIFSTMGEVVEWDGAGPRGVESAEVMIPGLRPDIPVALVLTSGTTGTPAPVPLSHRNLTASAEASARRLGLSAKDCWLTSLSPGHVGGLALLYRAAVVGCSLLTRPHFDATEATELMDAGLVSHASLVPVMLARLIEARGDRLAPQSLRCLLVGGARTPEPLLERALALGYPIALTYGLSEASSQVATAEPSRVRSKPGTVGPPLEGLELGLADPDREGRGEILVRGETVVHGLPRMAVPGPGEPRPASVFVDADGWLHTGDLGRLDEEGDLWVLGRRSERIVTGGVTVEPAEVEEVLLRHPRVREVAVIPVPDTQWGERIVAVVVAEDPAQPPSLDELLEFARDRLASAKRPRELRLLATLPRTAGGKVDRRVLAADDPPG